jgi:hypothetical protein
MREMLLPHVIGNFMTSEPAVVGQIPFGYSVLISGRVQPRSVWR